MFNNYLCTYDLYSPVHNVLDACISISERDVRGGWALEFESLMGPVKWHRVDRRVPFGNPKNSRKVSGPIVRGVEEQVHKGTSSPCSGRSPPLQNLLEIKRQL
jgi:hypothetical protein